AGFVLHDHFVSALPAIDDAVQERLAFTWHAAGFVTVVLGIIVTQHGLDFLKNFPVHIGRILVFHDDSPLLARQLLRKGLCTWSATYGAAAAVDEGAGVGGVLEHLKNGSDRGRAPARLTEAAAAGKSQVIAVEVGQYLGGGTSLQ